jgi:small ligand-binding sensory domain FIST
MSAAQSFSFLGDQPEKAARALAAAESRVQAASGAVVFAAGALGEQLPALAAAVARACPKLPCLAAAGAGVMSERGEVEGQAAASGVVWSGGTAQAFAVNAGSADAVGSALSRALSERSSGARCATALVFTRPSGLAPHVLEPLASLRQVRVIGAGTVGEAPVLAITRSGEIESGPAGGMVLTGIAAPLVCASPACRLLMPLRVITKTRGSMVLEIEGEPALETLSSVAEGLVDQPLVFVALAGEEAQPERPQVLIRAVQGVDPVRRGLVVSDEVRPGMRLSFAVRDAKAAREDLHHAVRHVLREAKGAAPRFGIYLNCAGRGSNLYGARDVDLKILRARLGDLPLAGMQSSFEVSEVAGRPALQLYTGVLSVFTAPS